MSVPFRYLPRFFSTCPQYQVAIPTLLSDYRQTPFTLQDGLSEWKGNGGLVFIEKDNSFLGMLQLKRSRTFLELSSFVMNPQFKGKGYGRALLESCLIAADMPVCLRVTQDNPAKHLYESVGFQVEEFSNQRYYMKYH